MERNLISVFFLLIVVGLLNAASRKRIDSVNWWQRVLIRSAVVAVAVTPLGLGYGAAILIVTAIPVIFATIYSDGLSPLVLSYIGVETAKARRSIQCVQYGWEEGCRSF